MCGMDGMMFMGELRRFDSSCCFFFLSLPNILPIEWMEGCMGAMLRKEQRAAGIDETAWRRDENI